jgi:hypothetical protein
VLPRVTISHTERSKTHPGAAGPSALTPGSVRDFLWVAIAKVLVPFGSEVSSTEGSGLTVGPPLPEIS